LGSGAARYSHKEQIQTTPARVAHQILVLSVHELHPYSVPFIHADTAIVSGGGIWNRANCKGVASDTHNEHIQTSPSTNRPQIPGLFVDELHPYSVSFIYADTGVVSGIVIINRQKESSQRPDLADAPTFQARYTTVRQCSAQWGWQ